ncbi:MAG TPA: leucine-rich repeat protein [Clostridia bacterium]|nr:leucine-rich repeat protein [Clostridia bacterium]
MKKNVNHTLLKGMILTLVGLCCVLLFAGKARAEEVDYAQSGDGWSLTADGVFTIENDAGWVDCLKNGFEISVNKLVIGKDVTIFRMYEVATEAPTPDFYDPSEIAGYDRFGTPYYEYEGASVLEPLIIEVETGNSIYKVVGGLLINTKTNEVVLSEFAVRNVEIPEGITGITLNAFSGRSVRSVKLPSSLTTIGVNAFAKCKELKSIDLPASLIELKAGAFSGCTSLQEISLPAGLQELGAYAFSYCPIQYIEIPQLVDEIGAYAFLDCDQLFRVSLPEKLKEIKHGTFTGCKQLRQINFPDQLESIGEQAFCGCKNLKQVILPDSLQEIGDKAFWWCDLSILRIPERLAFPVYNFKRDKFILNPYKKSDKSFGFYSVDTVILSGNDYDFGYPAITDAKDVYFLGKPPEDVGQILDENSVESIYCSDEFGFEWTRSTVASWVRQRLTIMPAGQINQWAETTINTTPVPTNTPRPTYTPQPTYAGFKVVNTPKPTATPQPIATPITEVSEQEPADPILFVFAGVLAIVVAGIAVVAVKSGKTKRHPQKKSK